MIVLAVLLGSVFVASESQAQTTPDAICRDQGVLDVASGSCAEVNVCEASDVDLVGEDELFVRPDEEFQLFDADAYAAPEQGFLSPAEVICGAAITCFSDEQPDGVGGCEQICLPPFQLNAAGDCDEVLDANHPCVSAGVVPSGVVSNIQLAGFSYLAGTGECVTHSELQERISDFEKSAHQETTAMQVLQSLAVELESIEVDMVEAQGELSVALDAQTRARVTATDAIANASAAREDLDRFNRLIVAERNLFHRQVVSAYMGGGEREITVAATTKSLNLFQTSMSYVRTVLDEQDRTIRRIESLEVEAQRRAETLADLVVVAEREVEVAATESIQVEQVLTKLEASRDRQAEAMDAGAAVAADLRARKTEFATVLGIEEGSSSEIEAFLATADSLVTSGTLYTGELFVPVEGAVTSTFGPRIHPVVGVAAMHRGIDIDSRFGVPIHAAVAGTVVISGSSHEGYGLVTVIDHGGGMATLYAHQSELLVSVGDQVDQGEVIGLIGSTGLSTGPHLHFEIRIDGVPIDPAPYLVAR